MAEYRLRVSEKGKENKGREGVFSFSFSHLYHQDEQTGGSRDCPFADHKRRQIQRCGGHVPSSPGFVGREIGAMQISEHTNPV